MTDEEFERIWREMQHLRRAGWDESAAWRIAFTAHQVTQSIKRGPLWNGSPS